MVSVRAQTPACLVMLSQAVQMVPTGQPSLLGLLWLASSYRDLPDMQEVTTSPVVLVYGQQLHLRK